LNLGWSVMRYRIDLFFEIVNIFGIKWIHLEKEEYQ
jgi:hypothetical protein